MKSFRSFLSTGSIVVAFMMFSVMSLQAQNAQAQSTDPLITQERIMPVQAGTVKLVNGSLSIALKETLQKQIAAKGLSYFVTLTPIGQTGQLKLKEKTGTQFTVQEVAQQGSNGTFDYVVLVKRMVATGLKKDAVTK